MNTKLIAILTALTIVGAFALALGPVTQETEVDTGASVSTALSNLTETLTDLIEPIIVLVIIFGIMGLIFSAMRFR